MLGSGDIDLFFSAAIRPGLWAAALDKLAIALGADGATLVAGPPHASSVAFSGSLARFMSDYQTIGKALDSRELRVQPTLRAGFLGDHDVFTPEEIERDPFYRYFLRPRGLGWHAAAQISTGQRSLVLSLKRRWVRGPFEASELRRMSRTLPNLRSAARMAAIAHDAQGGDLLRALSAKGEGGALLDGHGRVIATNPEMPDGDGLAIRRRQLVVTFDTDQIALDRAISFATGRTATEADRPPSRAILVHRPSGRAPFVVQATRLSHPMQPLLIDACALVAVVDPETARVPTVAFLRALYGLSPREADIAIEISRGRSLGQAAANLGISHEHARQRLKLIFEKTNVRKQVDLSSLIQRLA